MSMVLGNHHLIRDSFGKESLYDLDADPAERRDIQFSNDAPAVMGRLRASIHRILTSDPATIGISVQFLGRYTKALETLVGSRAGPDGLKAPEVPPRAGTGGSRASSGAESRLREPASR
jgi:hypothetical protein